MSVAVSIPFDKMAALLDLAAELQQFVTESAASGVSMYDTERQVWAKVLNMGHVAVDMFLLQQGNGDLGPTVETEESGILIRSALPVKVLRTSL